VAELAGLGWKRRGLVLTTNGTSAISGFSKMKKGREVYRGPVRRRRLPCIAGEIVGTAWLMIQPETPSAPAAVEPVDTGRKQGGGWSRRSKRLPACST
jgi:hypothetical protein